MTDDLEDGRHLPQTGENHRQTGARKLDPRPGEPLIWANNLHAPSSDIDDSRAHLMQPVVKEETHQYDGVNPPGTFAAEAEVKFDPVDEGVSTPTREQAWRPL